ncbi:MAG: enoyl-CoA hydratase/isomerase family protein, partial [Halioglobus sp.]|nr:enoyl-CoA hydratase/isomerase family protein [Halioglobus sp.]
MKDYKLLIEEAKQYIRYDKDKATKIAWLTFDRPEAQNATTAGMRQLYADYIHRANTDDDVKVLVIRGEGQDFGSGGDLPEQADMLSESDEDVDLRWEIGIDDPDVKYPPKKSYRFLHNLTDHYSKARAGCRPLQEFKKISIVEAKGYCYGWHFYQAGDADIVVSSDDALFGHPAFRYVGWGPRLWTWIEMMGLRKFEEMLFTGRPFTAQEMKECNNFINSVVPREALEKETLKYAMACARTRPTDTVQAQKTFIEMYKQYRGEYLGSV